MRGTGLTRCNGCGEPLTAEVALCDECAQEAALASELTRLEQKLTDRERQLVDAKRKIGAQLKQIVAAMGIIDDAIIYSDTDSYPTKEWRNRAAKWLKDA